jgi:hypothetical protein
MIWLAIIYAGWAIGYALCDVAKAIRESRP